MRASGKRPGPGSAVAITIGEASISFSLRVRYGVLRRPDKGRGQICVAWRVCEWLHDLTSEPFGMAGCGVCALLAFSSYTDSRHMGELRPSIWSERADIHAVPLHMVLPTHA